MRSLLLGAAIISGCGAGEAGSSTAATGAATASATTTSTVAATASATASAAPTEAPAPTASATASATPTATASTTAAPAGAATASPAAPTVKVVNIGMHIGGGPNDDVTKEPVKKSVEPHFEALRACFSRAEGGKGGDFGVDLLIPKDGGKAKVSHPRTSLGKDFQSCVVGVFEQIEFRKPKGGLTMVSYSLRFTP
jgi:pyruvate/2-oxoglutarate dehydrogenase complex dihydrolipoamide acyltransferase (E2) component